MPVAESNPLLDALVPQRFWGVECAPGAPGWPWGLAGNWWWCPPPPPKPLGPVVYVQCREAAWSANTVPPDWCWRGSQKLTRAVVACLRNGVECRCYCPPGRCEGKSGRQHLFRPWLPRAAEVS